LDRTQIINQKNVKCAPTCKNKKNGKWEKEKPGDPKGAPEVGEGTLDSVRSIEKKKKEGGKEEEPQERGVRLKKKRRMKTRT